jgi:hypothetical protein
MQKTEFTAEQIIEEIRTELKRPASENPPMLNHINQARQLMQQFRQRPVMGALTGLKKAVYNLNHSSFSQQYNINDSLLNLVEEIYHEFNQYRELTNKEISELKRQLEQSSES